MQNITNELNGNSRLRLTHVAAYVFGREVSIGYNWLAVGSDIWYKHGRETEADARNG